MDILNIFIKGEIQFEGSTMLTFYGDIDECNFDLPCPYLRGGEYIKHLLRNYPLGGGHFGHRHKGGLSPII